MIATDANMPVRCVTDDAASQTGVAAHLLASPLGVFIGQTVMLELEWVLRSAYRWPRDAIYPALTGIFGLPNVVTGDQEQVALALDYYRQGPDFADALHYVSSASAFHTVDVRFAKRSQRLGLDVHDITSNNR